mgnify:CR=1 FL=1
MGVDPTDNVTMDGAVRPIDSINVWPLLTHTNEDGEPPAGHEYLPLTEQTIVYQERYKLVAQAESTFWTTPNHTHVYDNRTAW